METNTTQDSGRGVTTQSIESVKSLLAFMGRDRGPLPEFVEIRIEDNDRVLLARNSKKDSYYIVTAKECSCKFFVLNGARPCKHITKYFGKTKQTLAETLVQADQNLSKMPKSYQRMVRAAREVAESEPSMSSGFKPVYPEGEPLSDFDRIT